MTTPSDLTKPPTFWKRWFGQTVDPKAGTFRHEVLARLGLGVAIVLIHYDLAITFNRPMLAGPGEYVLIFVPEMLLRRSWKIGVGALCTSLLAFALARHPDWSTTFPALGAWYGLLAGMGSRSLLACLLGIPLGSLGGWCGVTLFEWLLLDPHSPYITMSSTLGTLGVEILLFAATWLPIYFCAGLAVWLGMKWAQHGERKKMERAELIEKIERIIAYCITDSRLLWGIGLEAKEWKLFISAKKPDEKGEYYHRNLGRIVPRAVLDEERFKNALSEMHGLTYCGIKMDHILHGMMNLVRDGRLISEEEELIAREKARAEYKARILTPEEKEQRAASEFFFDLMKQKHLPPAVAGLAIGLTESEVLTQLRKYRSMGERLLPEYYQKYVDNEKDGAGSLGSGTGNGEKI